MSPGEPPAAAAARCRENLAAVRGRVAEACRRAGRDVAAVRLIAVTKYVSAAVARLLLDAGCEDLAESRPQEIWAKAAALGDHPPAPRWHLVGHLQRNKVRRTLPLVTLVHTLDSPRLLAALVAEATALGHPCDVLVEVNLAGDPTRTGVMPTDAPALVAAAALAGPVRLRGLMGMAGRPDGPQADARRDFAALRGLRDRLAADLPPHTLAELSMGMSGDFEAAILEGATMIRVGSALFAGLEPA